MIPVCFIGRLRRAKYGAIRSGSDFRGGRGTATVQGWDLLERLDRDLLALNASRAAVQIC